MKPLTFQPHHKTRVWGGRTLETHYARPLPDDQPYGEAWEIVDREASDEQSIVTSEGTFQEKTIRDLWMNHRAEVFGESFADHPSDHFPILIKILDARTALSIQVHPPKDVADKLGGEPKTEMWYIAHAEPGAKLYIGFQEKITEADFRKAIENGQVEDHVHAITPQAGESILLLSGRLHAIGAGLLIHEIQQTSDTTYRVFDWNRVGLDGAPRELHIEESLASIDFTDVRPPMDTADGTTLCTSPYFQVDKIDLAVGEKTHNPEAERFALHTVVEGQLVLGGVTYEKGQTFLTPPRSEQPSASATSTVLTTTIPL